MTIYVTVDALYATKLIYVTLGVIYLVSLVQLFYGGARPFWTTETVLTADCLNNYTHPSLGLVFMVFLPYYAFYCWKKRSG